MQGAGKKVYVLFVACLVLAGLLLLLAFRIGDTSRWEAMTDRVGQLKIAARVREVNRSVLTGEPIGGNAWEDYNVALEDAVLLAREDQNGSIYYQFASGDTKVDRARVRQLVAGHAKAIEHLRLGAKRSDGQYLYNWEMGPSMDYPGFLASRKLGNIALAQSRILTEKGRPQEAAELLLDTAVFAKDLSTNSPLLSNLIGMAMYYTAFDGLQQLLLSRRLTPKQLADLAAKLEIVDRDFPAVSSMTANEPLSIGMYLTALTSGPAALTSVRERERYYGWRFAVFPSQTVLEAFETSDLVAQRFQQFDELSFPEAKKEVNALAARTNPSSNALLKEVLANMPRVLENHHEALAKLRLMRAAATLLATGKMPTIVDPFGTHILSRRDRNTIRIWSVGRDGTSQNGVGDWTGQPDIVLEIPVNASR